MKIFSYSIDYASYASNLYKIYLFLLSIKSAFAVCPTYCSRQRLMHMVIFGFPVVASTN